MVKVIRPNTPRPSKGGVPFMSIYRMVKSNKISKINFAIVLQSHLYGLSKDLWDIVYEDVVASKEGLIKIVNTIHRNGLSSVFRQFTTSFKSSIQYNGVITNRLRTLNLVMKHSYHILILSVPLLVWRNLWQPWYYRQMVEWILRTNFKPRNTIPEKLRSVILFNNRRIWKVGQVWINRHSIVAMRSFINSLR